MKHHLAWTSIIIATSFGCAERPIGTWEITGVRSQSEAKAEFLHGTRITLFAERAEVKLGRVVDVRPASVTRNGDAITATLSTADGGTQTLSADTEAGGTLSWNLAGTPYTAELRSAQ
jgi:hypothetical protein